MAPGALSPGAVLLRGQECPRTASQVKEPPRRSSRVRAGRLTRLLPRASVSSSSSPAPSAPAPAAVTPLEAVAGSSANAAPSPPVVEVVEEVAVQEEAPFRVVTLTSTESKVDYLGESTKGDMKLKRQAATLSEAPLPPPATPQTLERVPGVGEGVRVPAPTEPAGPARGARVDTEAEAMAMASGSTGSPSFSGAATAATTASKPGQSPPSDAPLAAARASTTARSGERRARGRGRGSQ